MKKTYKDTINFEQKKKLIVIFQVLCVATQKFCNDRDLFETWAWQYVDINKKFAWLSKIEKLEFNFVDNIDNNFNVDIKFDINNDVVIKFNIDNDVVVELDINNDVVVEFSIGNVNDFDNDEDTNMNDATNSIVNAKFAINDDITINKIMNKLTLNDESILFKR